MENVIAGVFFFLTFPYLFVLLERYDRIGREHLMVFNDKIRKQTSVYWFVDGFYHRYL